MFQYRKRYGLHAMMRGKTASILLGVSIPQAVWIACNSAMMTAKKRMMSFNTASGMDCMQYDDDVEDDEVCSFNTASGMDCMQCRPPSLVSSPTFSFNTASGMDCMQ